ARRFVAVVALRPGRGDQLVAEVAGDRVPIALGRRSPAAGARRGQPDAVAGAHRRAGELARRALAEGFVHRAPVIGAGGLELDRGLAALLAAMQAPGPDFLAVAEEADRDRGCLAAQRLGRAEATAEAADAAGIRHQSVALDLPGIARLVDLDRGHAVVA